MNPSFLETLQNEGRYFADLTTIATKIDLPCFADLIWPGDQIDPQSLNVDPGVQFIWRGRTFVLMRVGDQIRYYAGPVNASTVAEEWELGVLPSASSALSFGCDYLINQRPLSTIAVKREVRFPADQRAKSKLAGAVF